MDPESSRRASLGPTLVLSVVLAFAVFALLMSLVMLAKQPEHLAGAGSSGCVGGCFGVAQRQSAESALYIAAFFVVLPLAVIVGPKLADAIAAGPNAPALASLAGILLATLATAVLVVRVSDNFSGGGGMGVLLAVVGVWSIGAAAALARASRNRPWPALLRLPRLAPWLWAATALLVLGTLLGVADLGSLSPLPLVVGAIAVPASFLLYDRGRVPRLGWPWGTVTDVVLLSLVLLAVLDLVGLTPDDPTASFLDRYRFSVAQFHEDFFLRPANQVLGGDAMLVDTSSQYGVGSIYLVAAWFKLETIGYGTLALLDGVVTALYFGAGYSLLRVARCSRLLAASAMAVAVVALVLNRPYPVGALLQEGPLRFGLPLALILAIVAGARWPGQRKAAQAVALGVLALSSLWALEAFAYTVATLAAMTSFQAYLLPMGGRIRWLIRQAALAAAACIGAHVLFALATLVTTGELPDWGQYLAYLDAFLFGSLGDLTYDISRWSPALAVAAAYLASAAAVVLMLRRDPDLVAREQVTLLAIAGTTAYGIVLFSYFVDRSGEHVVAYISLPAVLIASLWLGVLQRSAWRLPRNAAAGALAFVVTISVLMVSVGWSTAEPRFGHTALAHVVPGGDSTKEALDRMRHFPPLSGRGPIGAALLNRYMPGERRSVVIVNPGTATEALIRSERVNRLPLANLASWDEGAVARQLTPGLRDAVGKLEPGQRMLIDKGAVDALAALRADPASDPLTDPQPGMAPLQVFALKEITKRFRLQPIHRDKPDFVVVRLTPRR